MLWTTTSSSRKGPSSIPALTQSNCLPRPNSTWTGVQVTRRKRGGMLASAISTTPTSLIWFKSCWVPSTFSVNSAAWDFYWKVSTTIWLCWSSKRKWKPTSSWQFLKKQSLISSWTVSINSKWNTESQPIHSPSKTLALISLQDYAWCTTTWTSSWSWMVASSSNSEQ